MLCSEIDFMLQALRFCWIGSDWLTEVPPGLTLLARSLPASPCSRGPSRPHPAREVPPLPLGRLHSLHLMPHPFYEPGEVGAPRLRHLQTTLQPLPVSFVSGSLHNQAAYAQLVLGVLFFQPW